MAPEEEATGLSLWIEPEDAAREALVALIARLAREHRAPLFEPHVTLLAAIDLAEEEVLVRAEALAGVVAPLRVRLAGVGGLEEYFRCLFLRVELTSELMGANARARAAFGRHADPPFFPHLSLLYGRLGAGEMSRLTASIGIPVEGFVAPRLSLVRTVGRVADWRPLSAFRLGSGGMA